MNFSTEKIYLSIKNKDSFIRDKPRNYGVAGIPKMSDATLSDRDKIRIFSKNSTHNIKFKQIKLEGTKNKIQNEDVLKLNCLIQKISEYILL